MARLKYGILGPVLGKIANLVGYLRLGQPILRSKPKKPKKKKVRSDAQKAVNLRFKLVKSFISVIGEFIHEGYRLDVAKSDRIPENGASSYLLNEAVTGDYPNYEIDYSKVLVSRGRLQKPSNPTVKLEGNTLKFYWDVDPNWGYELNRDQVMVLAYLPTNGTADYSLSGARRKEGYEELKVGIVRQDQYDLKKDDFIEVYIAFVSDNRKRISDSVYLGSVAV
ncbi:DUF6266 family protein [Pedobacter nyackensis]|uniref:DUF6266 family protein n=1 Tax=Pedobacter nyackensis TaxID=475255 RepID=UPI00292D6B89|nr:DUF6266 family protein [Pedobacter nyackensis]